MQTEIEAKFYPVNKGVFRKKLKTLGAKLIIPERKMKTVLGDKRNNPNLNCDYIRIRDEGNLIRLSAKIHAKESGKLSDQKETEIEVSDFGKMVEILKRSGLKLTYYQEKLRETWELEGAIITIDTWPGLETYSEIEASSEKEVKRIAEKLGFDWNKKIIAAGAEVFAKVYGLSIDNVLEKISNITFDNNPFEGMKKIWPK